MRIRVKIGDFLLCVKNTEGQYGTIGDSAQLRRVGSKFLEVLTPDFVTLVSPDRYVLYNKKNFCHYFEKWMIEQNPKIKSNISRTCSLECGDYVLFEGVEATVASMAKDINGKDTIYFALETDKDYIKLEPFNNHYRVIEIIHGSNYRVGRRYFKSDIKTIFRPGTSVEVAKRNTKTVELLNLLIHTPAWKEEATKIIKELQ